MTNPGNSIGTNGAFGGRTSPNALNDVLSAFSKRGILSGWSCVPKGGLTVSLGGNGVDRDVAIAMDDVGNKVTVNNISETPIDVTLSAAPTVGQRIDSIVAYVANPPQGSATEMDNPGACGLVIVQGNAVASNPTAPDEAAIRSAIGADGAASATAYYVVLAQITMSAGLTDITASAVTAGEPVQIPPIPKLTYLSRVVNVNTSGLSDVIVDEISRIFDRDTLAIISPSYENTSTTGNINPFTIIDGVINGKQEILGSGFAFAGQLATITPSLAVHIPKGATKLRVLANRSGGSAVRCGIVKYVFLEI